jgi:ABC-2 type transport system ATP-binding protein
MNPREPHQSKRSSIVTIRGLSHRYSTAWAIRDINFDIEHNGIVGLLGSNGAGKSTTMNILCGVLNQTEGQVHIDGIDLRENPEEAKKRLGFLPQNPPLHLDFTVDEYLIHCAYLRLMSKQEIPAALNAAKERCGVAHMSKRLIRNLSGGYRQRVGIAQAIIHRPKLVVLDEPTNGLDPNQIVEVRSLIKEIAEERAVLFSSHILSEIHATCRRVMMIENGRMVFDDSIDAFNNHIQPQSILLMLGAPPSPEVLRTLPGVTSVEFVDAQTVRLGFVGDTELGEQIIERSVAEGWKLRELQLERNSLESVFRHLSQRAPIEGRS